MGLFTETQVTQGELGSFQTVRDVWPSETLGEELAGDGYLSHQHIHSADTYPAPSICQELPKCWDWHGREITAYIPACVEFRIQWGDRQQKYMEVNM